VILSGGSGTRLWPLSRELYPKQLLPLVNERTMLQDTALRLVGLADVAAPIIVCNEQQRFMVAEQLRLVGVEPQAILLEPVGRNTAPAVAVAALAALEVTVTGTVTVTAANDPVTGTVAVTSDDDPLLLVLPADHVIRDVGSFQRAVVQALPAARAGQLVTFGVVPSHAETGYGYIRKGAGPGPVVPVAEFVEKPDAERAAQFLASGEYLWNSGMFLFSARRYLEELARHAPQIREVSARVFAAAKHDLDFTRLPADLFAECPSDSIDYAVMEKTGSAAVIPLAAGWSDVGSWASLKDALPGDARNNVEHGDVVSVDTDGCLLFSSSRLVATVGLKDHVVVETKDAILVAPRDRVQDVKLLVNRLKELGRGEPSLHREVFRPWGSYDSVDAGERFQVKRLTVKPGASMSLQMHHHRAEHWIVVSGTARITRGAEIFLLAENESTYIPIGTTHRIENPGKVPLYMIEVQSGSYLGEDDIVRFEDVYGRS
jgi:mannose-1-phosphate guanylyltransferase/mannose-6-phosphate isomerase